MLIFCAEYYNGYMMCGGIIMICSKCKNEIPDNIIPSVAQGDKIVVLDPFMGSGTVAKSAIKYNCDYIGFEIDEKYIDMFLNEKRD